ncbi:MAG TPA: hypothetical protein VMF86_16270 [Stellaceae bacterium]|nr:hypothetical protein [Stellaceae bacterium]
MGIVLNFGCDALLGICMLAGLSAVLLTVLIMAACAHPVLPIVAMLLVAGAISK